MSDLTWIEISKKALAANAKQFSKILGETTLMAVVKSNAYGHGYREAAKALEHHVDWFGSASLSEALILRKSGIKKPILVLNYYDKSEIPLAIKNNISLPITSNDQIALIEQSSVKLKKHANVHLKIDTGLSRLGIMKDDILNTAKRISNSKFLNLEGVYSHFAASEDHAPFTKNQIKLFKEAIELIEKNGIKFKFRHIACTASSLAFPQSRFDMVRIGIGIYGMKSYKSTGTLKKLYPNYQLFPALSWKAKVLATRKVKAGSYIGYGLSYRANKDMKIAILPVGYYEGYDRKLSNQGEVLIRGRRCKVVGRVYMNVISVDVSHIDVKVGDEAVLIGRQGNEQVSADELAEKIGTINYEVVARINPLIPRKLI